MRRDVMVPPAQPRSYYGQPILKEHVWKWPIPTYFFLGGMAGSSATLAGLAQLSGHRELARVAGRVSALALAASPPLLIADLGKRSRFANMLRVFRPTSPMSMGSWLLAVVAPAGIGAAVSEATGVAPRLGRLARAVATAGGPLLSTYTAVLVADTAVPSWHESRRELPFVFAAGSAASAGGAVVASLRPAVAAPARRLAIGGAIAELAAAHLMKRRLGSLGRPQGDRTGRLLSIAAAGTSLAGATLLAARGRHRTEAVVAGLAIAAGSALERFAITATGRASARDPGAMSGPQRSRVDAQIAASSTK